ERLQFLDKQAAGDVPGELPKALEIPAIAVGAMRLAPLQELLDDDQDGVGRQRLLLGGRHHLVISPEGGFLIGAEIDLTSADLDVPELAGLDEERLREVRH